MECLRDENGKDCPCTYDCELHGLCCECVRKHRAKGQLPACYFSEAAEKTYDRSIGNFLKDRNQR